MVKLQKISREEVKISSKGVQTIEYKDRFTRTSEIIVNGSDVYSEGLNHPHIHSYEKSYIVVIDRDVNLIIVSIPNMRGTSFTGTSKLHPLDKFDLEKGIKIAYKRALLKKTEYELEQLCI